MPALELRNKKPLGKFDSKEQKLMALLLNFSHISLAIEIQGQAEHEHAKYRQEMIITQSPAAV